MSERYRVLRLIARMNVGGPAIEVHNLMSDIDTSIFNQLLITGTCNQDESEYLERTHVSFPLIKLSHFGREINLRADIQTFFEIRRIMREFQPTIVHTHTSKAGLIGRLASISLFRKHIRVHTYHGHLLNGYFSRRGTLTVMMLERMLSWFTHALISVGRSVRDELLREKIGTVKKYRVISPGFDFTLLRDAVPIRRELNVTNAKFVVCWIGRFVSIKRPERLIEISRVLKNRNISIQFLMVGDGPLREKAEKMATREELPINFLGWRDDIGAILQSSDLLVLTSENEGTPIAIMEAQALGIPVVATRVGSVDEVIQDRLSGFVADYEPQIFAGLIVSLLEDEDLRMNAAQSAVNFAEQNFTLEHFIKKHEALYAELISLRSPNRLS